MRDDGKNVSTEVVMDPNLKYDTSGKTPILLVPQPSDDPNDPLVRAYPFSQFFTYEKLRTGPLPNEIAYYSSSPFCQSSLLLYRLSSLRRHSIYRSSIA